VSSLNLTDLSAPPIKQGSAELASSASRGTGKRHARLYRAEHRVLRGANPCDERARGNALHAAHMLWV